MSTNNTKYVKTNITINSEKLRTLLDESGVSLTKLSKFVLGRTADIYKSVSGKNNGNLKKFAI